MYVYTRMFVCACTCMITTWSLQLQVGPYNFKSVLVVMAAFFPTYTHTYTHTHIRAHAYHILYTHTDVLESVLMASKDYNSVLVGMAAGSSLLFLTIHLCQVSMNACACLCMFLQYVYICVCMHVCIYAYIISFLHHSPFIYASCACARVCMLVQ